jgi:hypothetical protein
MDEIFLKAAPLPFDFNWKTTPSLAGLHQLNKRHP